MTERVGRLEKHREKVNPVSGHIAEQSRVKPRKREAPTDDFQTEVCLSGLFVFLQKNFPMCKNLAYCPDTIQPSKERR